MAEPQVAAELKKRIGNRTARVGVLGLGYVGLPLAVEFARAGFEVTGIDVQKSKVDQFNGGHSYIKDVKEVYSNRWCGAANCARRAIFR